MVSFLATAPVEKNFLLLHYNANPLEFLRAIKYLLSSPWKAAQCNRNLSHLPQKKPPKHRTGSRLQFNLFFLFFYSMCLHIPLKVSKDYKTI